MHFLSIIRFYESFLSKYQCHFRKGYSTQYCLLAVLEKWKSAVDKGKSFGALLTDLSIAFDCLSHELLLAKLHAYGFSIVALRLIHSCLTERRRRTKINMSYISWEEIVVGIPHGSILGPLLFNILLCDLFLIMKETDFSSYADDNTPYTTADTIEKVTKLLERDSKTLFKWFSDNQIGANINKCSGECSKRLRRMLKKIPGNVRRNSVECSKKFRVMFKKIPGNVREDSGECSRKFREI